MARRIADFWISPTLLVALVGLLFAVAGPALAATRIEVIVNDQPITNYAIDQRAKLIRLTGGKGNIRERAIDELIDESLQMQEAKRNNVTVPDSRVDSAFAEIAKRVKLSPANFSKALSQNGVNPSTLKERLRAQIAWSQVVGARFRSSNTITEQDLIAQLREKGSGGSKDTAEYLLERVIVVVPEKASRGEVSSAEATARQLRSRFTSCEEGLAMTKQVQGVVVKQVGRRLSNEVPDQVRPQIEETSVGHLTPPVRGEGGLVMFAVCDKKTVKSTEAAIEEVQSEIIGEEGELFSRQYLRNLRKNAVIERR
ncbi:SurA N-terminal domain-containing protein [Amorphus sp. 3PC139-8]|uniref:SurA N-terminal domain-containing protein n=1 Tax=Amorphus sp. 3PC139-8 TaxID=2735676 RepID=UPI00345C6873